MGARHKFAGTMVRNAGLCLGGHRVLKGGGRRELRRWLEETATRTLRSDAGP
jgi:hypothetical protein